MTIPTLLRIERVFVFLIPVFFISTALVVFVSLKYPATGRRVLPAFVVIGMAYVGCILGVLWYTNSRIWQELLLEGAAANSVRFEAQNQVVTLEGKDVQTLLRLLKDAETVSPHHSTQRDTVQMVFGTGKVYWLARDSDAQDELWILATKGENPKMCIRQVKSEQLLRFLAGVLPSRPEGGGSSKPE